MSDLEPKHPVSLFRAEYEGSIFLVQRESALAKLRLQFAERASVIEGDRGSASRQRVDLERLDSGDLHQPRPDLLPILEPGELDHGFDVARHLGVAGLRRLAGCAPALGMDLGRRRGLVLYQLPAILDDAEGDRG